jgi:hypothetical protein
MDRKLVVPEDISILVVEKMFSDPVENRIPVVRLAARISIDDGHYPGLK